MNILLDNTLEKKLIILDSHALIHRAFHGIRELNLKDGTPINAVYGFTRILLTMIERENPDYFVVVKDMPGKTFRHERFVEYKATRTKAPDALYSQIPLVYELVSAFNIPILGVPGFEADDIAGTVSKSRKIPDDVKRLLVTGDFDYLQLVDEKTTLVKFVKGFTEVDSFTPERIQAVYGLTPEQIIDLKALKGDSSDNIPGVRGIGEKTALKLLAEFKTLENLYHNLDKVTSASVKELLIKYREDAFLSHELSRINTLVDIDFNLEECKFSLEENVLDISQMFRKFEFFTLENRLEKIIQRKTSKQFMNQSLNDKVKETQQTSLF